MPPHNDRSARRPARSARPGRPSRRARLACFAALLAAGASGCAGAASERNLAPLFSSHSAAGGVPEIEALGGAVVTRMNPSTGGRRYWAFRPIVSNRYKENGDRFAWFLPPLGIVKEDASTGDTVTQIIPLMRYATRVEPSGFVTWTLLVLPSIYWAAYEDGRTQKAVFPFGGVVENFLSLDRGTFVLFPLWMRFERYGRTTDHFLWPFFTSTRGTGGPAWRVWPIAADIKWEGRYRRNYFLWPFFHWQTNDIQFGPENTQHSWMVWPLIGRSRRGNARNTSVAWPFFGYATDPDTGFYSWDGPWPLVVFQGGDPKRATRKRVWPFYSVYKGDGLTSRWVAWPIVNWRTEVYEDGTKKTFKAFPVWRSYTRERTALSPASRDPIGTERYRKLWPLGKVRTAPGVHELDVIDLNVLPDYQFIDEHFAWLWELYTRHQNGDEVRSRSWLGLWRREKDADEDRRSLSVLWSARDYTRAGREAHERSFLFGLVRYRTVEGDGFTMLRPAFPGPGWPIRRTPSSLSPAAAPAEASAEASATPLQPTAGGPPADSLRAR